MDRRGDDGDIYRLAPSRGCLLVCRSQTLIQEHGERFPRISSEGYRCMQRATGPLHKTLAWFLSIVCSRRQKSGRQSGPGRIARAVSRTAGVGTGAGTDISRRKRATSFSQSTLIQTLFYGVFLGVGTLEQACSAQRYRCSLRLAHGGVGTACSDDPRALRTVGDAGEITTVGVWKRF